MEHYPQIQDIPTIKRIMDTFDFQKVHAYMTSINWKWGSGLNSARVTKTIDAVPSVEDLKVHAHYLLDCVSLDTSGHTRVHVRGSGGFFAIKNSGTFELIFSIEDKFEVIDQNP